MNLVDKDKAIYILKCKELEYQIIILINYSLQYSFIQYFY